MVIAVDSAGNSYHAGTFHGTLTLGNQTFSQTSVSGYPWDGTGISDAYVGKLLSNGTWDWVSMSWPIRSAYDCRRHRGR